MKVQPPVRRLVLDRAEERCELCGEGLTDDYSIHHRRPRGMGGSTDPVSASPANLLALCGSGTTGCHGNVERARRLSLDLGFLVSQYQDPAQVEVLRRGDWCYLTVTGGLSATPPPLEACS